MRSRALAGREGSLPGRWAFTIISKVYRTVFVHAMEKPGKIYHILYRPVYTRACHRVFSRENIVRTCGRLPRSGPQAFQTKRPGDFQAFFASASGRAAADDRSRGTRGSATYRSSSRSERRA